MNNVGLIEQQLKTQGWKLSVRSSRESRWLGPGNMRCTVAARVVEFFNVSNGVKTGSKTHQIRHDLDMIIGHIKNNPQDDS